MKLINKETGGLANCEPIEVKTDAGFHDYYSLAELNSEWEDYAPKEPIIKDEKIRKAVRAWADANGVGVVLYKEDNYRFYADDTEIGSMIEFEDMSEYIELRHEQRYTIDELCGEE